MRRSELAARLRLIVITDEALARPRSMLDVVKAAVEAGAPSVQLRMKGAGAREMFELGQTLLPVVHGHDGLFFVNDRVDVALALGADGVHVGPTDMPVAAVRRAARRAGGGELGRRPLLIGASSDDPEDAAALVAEGADYIGCGTVFPTTTKPDAGAAIGVAGLQRVVEAADAPIVGIGGIDAAGSAKIAAETRAAGVAVVGAVMGADDVGAAVRSLMAEWKER